MASTWIPHLVGSDYFASWKCVLKKSIFFGFASFVKPPYSFQQSDKTGESLTSEISEICWPVNSRKGLPCVQNENVYSVLSICRQKYILPFSSGIFTVLCRISKFISDRCEFNSVRNGHAALRSFIPGSGWDQGPLWDHSGTPKFKVGRLYLRSTLKALNTLE